MMLTFPNIVLIMAGTTTALMAGLFFAFSVSVNAGLGRLPNPEYIVAMQSINRSIQNPLFFIIFFSTVLLLPFSTWLHYGVGLPIRFWLLLIAAILHFMGVFGITVFGNIPLNERLDGFNIQSATSEGIASQRDKFERPWNIFNTVRSIVSTLTVILVILACLADHPIAVDKNIPDTNNS